MCVTCCAVAVLMRPSISPSLPPLGVVSLLVKYHFSKLLFKGEEPNTGLWPPGAAPCARIATCFCETVNTWILL